LSERQYNQWRNDSEESGGAESNGAASGKACFFNERITKWWKNKIFNNKYKMEACKETSVKTAEIYEMRKEGERWKWGGGEGGKKRKLYCVTWRQWKKARNISMKEESWAIQPSNGKMRNGAMSLSGSLCDSVCERKNNMHTHTWNGICLWYDMIWRRRYGYRQNSGKKEIIYSNKQTIKWKRRKENEENSSEIWGGTRRKWRGMEKKIWNVITIRMNKTDREEAEEYEYIIYGNHLMCVGRSKQQWRKIY